MTRRSIIVGIRGQQGPVLYNGEKGINNAADPPESGPAEPGSLLTDSPLKSLCTKQQLIMLGGIFVSESESG